MFLKNQPTVIHHDANTTGRDFIVGDLHGCRGMLDTLLEYAGFDASQDRLFSVGDLVDRGPDSEGCLDLLREPWFFPVMGNHDAMLLAWILGDTRDPRQQIYKYIFTRNKGWKWAKGFRKAGDFLPLLENLPLVRVIGKDAGPTRRFHVAHAELRMSGSASCGFTDLDLDMSAASLVWDDEHFVPGFDVGDWRDHVLCGRSLIKVAQSCIGERMALPPEQYPYLSTTYVGHTIVPPVFGPGQNEALRVQSHVFLDSGAFKAAQDSLDGDPRYGLTLWCHTENRGWLVGCDGAVRDVFRVGAD